MFSVSTTSCTNESLDSFVFKDSFDSINSLKSSVTFVSTNSLEFSDSFVAFAFSDLAFAFSSLAAFAFSRLQFKGRELVFNIFLTTMMIPGEMMTISNYITVVGYLNGKDTYWAMIIPFLISVYYIYLLRQNFKQIPNELYYAAKVDGTGDFK